ncbi:hypothetical protein GMA3_64 [Gordonia phage GMA3]|uniref:Uncharacterized protein n=1 Tax=Gordonia phage GMA3 TaxID=1647284 RepID=A0A0K0NKK9_9CAUD|nr:hypothetical protein AU105_gp064 [Gordonia phage GMA3]AKL88241.1 hypothetical protein GMA3_64 [Gordonia phage GMA3]
MAEMTYRTKYFVTQGSEDYRIATAVRAVVDMLIDSPMPITRNVCGNRNHWGDKCGLPKGHASAHAALNKSGAVCVEWEKLTRAAL